MSTAGDPVLDISSEDEDLMCLTMKRLQRDGDDDDDEDVVVIDKSEFVVNFSERRPRKRSHVEASAPLDNDDDCCVVVSAPSSTATLHSPSTTDDVEELVVTGETGLVACRDFPHARHLCAQFPFKTTEPFKHCKQCHCYVCDVLAPCMSWQTHCQASDKEECWKALRKSKQMPLVPANVAASPAQRARQVERLPGSRPTVEVRLNGVSAPPMPSSLTMADYARGSVSRSVRPFNINKPSGYLKVLTSQAKLRTKYRKQQVGDSSQVPPAAAVQNVPCYAGRVQKMMPIPRRLPAVQSAQSQAPVQTVQTVQSPRQIPANKTRVYRPGVQASRLSPPEQASRLKPPEPAQRQKTPELAQRQRPPGALQRVQLTAQAVHFTAQRLVPSGVGVHGGQSTAPATQASQVFMQTPPAVSSNRSSRWDARQGPVRRVYHPGQADQHARNPVTGPVPVLTQQVESQVQRDSTQRKQGGKGAESGQLNDAGVRQCFEASSTGQAVRDAPPYMSQPAGSFPLASTAAYPSSGAAQVYANGASGNDLAGSNYEQCYTNMQPAEMVQVGRSTDYNYLTELEAFLELSTPATVQ